ncbi:MAG TPA: CDP-alcohol phosphatidyltransferase family protein, partial [Ornithinibacter sp.]|nr:CDP-alcohol phosphatidyltransferase family protein [Ornithinibacter sp.]
AAGWVVGLGCGAVLTAALVRAAARAGRATLGPADRVTLGRTVLACGVAALTAESLLGHDVTVALVALAVPALALDAVDGRVARRTGTVTAFGGRLDGEADAFLILVLSAAVAPATGWWVLAAGLARYAFAAAGWALPWMRGRLEFRYWRKVVTATVGVVLTVALADVLPRGLTVAVVLVALALLTESFGRDVWWLWRHRPAPSPARPGGRAPRPGPAAVTTVLAVALVWFALVAPTRPDLLTPGAFLRLPVEAVVLATLALAASARSSRSRRAVTVVVGALLAAVTLLKILDLGAFAVLDRPFNVVTDHGQLGSGVAFVRDSVGPWAARGSVVGAVLLVGAVAACLPWAVGRLTRVLERHRRRSTRAVAVLAAVWVVCAVSGVRLAPGEPVAAADAGPFVVDKVRATTVAYGDRERFDRVLAADAFRDPASADLSALRGKDVVVAFVESYGRVALEGPESDSVRALLDEGTVGLRDLGYTAASAWLTSPTFGGSSWLAHSTLQSGLEVGHQGQYDRLLSSSRTTLTSAFSRAGWRTVAVLPATHGDWPEGRAFYRFDEVYDGSTLGYAGPRFGFSSVPDQFALSAFERLELARPDRVPVMAEVALTSSHGPWAPLPTIVEPADLGDGSVFHGIRAQAVTAPELWDDRAAVPAAYRTSIRYSLTSVLSFVEDHRGDDLVLVLLGDHQPSTIVSGFGGDRDVPVTVLARDPGVVEAISAWRWQEGLRPDARAPVWPMADFRDRFLAAFSSPGSSEATRGQARP